MRKNLLVLGMSIATVVIVSLFAFQKNAEQTYVPRAENGSVKGISHAQEYYAKVRADLTTGKVNPELILQKKAEITAQINAQLQSFDKSGSVAMNWVDMGPNNVGGRTRSVITLKNNSNIMYMGSVTGGLWKSVNAGQSWNIVSSFVYDLSISAIAELGNGWIVVGTGSTFESNPGFGGSASLGNGLYISKDNGATFSFVKDANNVNVEYSKGWTAFNRLMADPNNPTVVWAACSKGLMKMNMQTGEFVVPTGAIGTLCYDLAVSVTGNHIIASYSSSVYLSKNGGDSFSKVSGGTGLIKTPTNRSTVAISPDNEAYMYAMLTKTVSGKQGQYMDGLYYSTDTGSTWAITWTAPQTDPFQSANGQGFYDQAITVVPGQPGVVVVGGASLWIAGPNHQPEAIAIHYTSEFSPYYVHADIHHLSWIGTDKLLIGTDGGVYVGTFNGSSFTFGRRNNGLNATQFYAIGIDGRGRVMGGTQDNGTQYVKYEGANPQAAVEVLGGDGFTSDMSVLVPGAAIGSIYNGAFFRSQNINAGGFSRFVDDITTGDFGGFNTLGALFEREYDKFANRVQYTYINDTRDPLPVGHVVTVNSEVLSGKTFSYPLEEVLAVDDTITFFDKTNVMYAVDAGSSIYLTREIWNFGTTPEFWEIAQNQDYVNQMAFSSDGDHLFLAKLGGITRISGLRGVWNEAQATVGSPDYALTVTPIIGGGVNTLSDIAVSRLNPNHVVAVRYGYNAGLHVFQSMNATEPGASFTSIQGDLPDIPVFSVEIDYTDPNIIYIGTDEGIYVTEDGGTTWVNQAVNGIERVPVFDIKGQNNYAENITNTGGIYAGTHGRGFFKMENRVVDFDPASVGVEEVNVVANDLKLQVYPNPVVNNVTVAFEINNEDNATLSILNLTGQVVKTINANNLSKNIENKVQFNVSELPVGTYLVHLNNGTDQRTARFIKAD